MRSLRLCRLCVNKLPEIEKESITKIISSDQNVAIATTEGRLFMSDNGGAEFEEIPTGDPSGIVDIHFLFDGSLWVANEMGQVFTVSGVDRQFEEIGFQETGISAARWSPDGELLVLISLPLENEDALQVLTADFEPIAVQAAVTTQPGEQVMVNVGWGSRSTQFMGQAGKESREIELKAATKLSDRDNLQIGLCWRGDAELFCTSVPCSSGRRTRIYNREGVHLSTTDSPSTFLGPISWRASSLLSTVAESISGQLIVAQIERNGLEHGQIDLILQDQPVTKIAWNASGVLLLVQYSDYFELWRQENYHWYRQVLQKITNDGTTFIYWDDCDANVLHVSSGGILSKYHIEAFINVYQSSKILVADGKFNNFTDYEKAIIPPPMFQSQFDSLSSKPAVVTEDGALIVTDNAIVDARDQSVMMKGEFSDVNQIFALGKKAVFLVHDTLDGSEFEYITPETSIRDKTLSPCWITHFARIDDHAFFVSMLNHLGEYQLVKVQVEKEGLQYTPLDISPSYHMYRNLSCSQGEPVYLCKNQPYFGLDKLPLKNGETVLSLAANNEFIAATTTCHELLIWDLSKAKGAAGVQSWQPVRRGCERGASIVTLFGTKVVLQMPRGNIETVEPRAMLFKQLGSLLDEEKVEWKQLFKMCRRQRVNLNLLVDHSGYENFPASDFFIELLPKTAGKNEVDAFLNFIYELSEQNCTHPGGLYHEIYRERSERPPKEADKVKLICNTIAEKAREDEERLSLFLKIYLHCTLKVVGMEKTLVAMAELRQQKQVPVEKLSEGIKFLAIMQQGDHDLYHFSLKTFDLELALIAAQAIELDPKEYLANLNKLDKLEENFRKYVILDQLECYSDALLQLIHLHNLKDDVERNIPTVEDYVNRHNLFNFVIRLPNLSKQFKKDVCRAWADKMKDSSHDLQAAILYKQSGDEALRKCSALFSKRQRWRLASDQKALRSDFDERLASIPTQDAGHASWGVNRDPEESVRLFVEANQFENALMVCNSTGRADLLQTDIQPAVKSHALSILEQLKEIVKAWSERLLRLEECKANQLKKIQIMNEGYDEDKGDFDDLVSDLGSVRTGSSRVSRSSRSTAKSAKSRRKNERKKFSTRKGSPTEHLGLLEEAKSSVGKFQKIVDELGSFFVVLGYCGEFILGAEIQDLVKKFINDLEHEIHKIWPRDDEGLVLLENFQKEGTLRDLRDLSVLAPPEIPKRFHNFSIFD